MTSQSDALLHNASALAIPHGICLPSFRPVSRRDVRGPMGSFLLSLPLCASSIHYGLHFAVRFGPVGERTFRSSGSKSGSPLANELSWQ